MAHTENSGKGGISSNSQSTYTTSNSLTVGDFIKSSKAMSSALTSFAEDPYFYGHPNAQTLKISNGAGQ